MTPQRLRDIAIKNGAGDYPEVLAAVAEAAFFAANEMRELYLKALHGIELPKVQNCKECRKKLINQGKSEIRKDIRSLLHIKGWNE